jgi:hypothetical protein
MAASDVGGGPTTPVVTLFESFGSGADYIGPRVAAALGVPFHPGAFSSQEIEDAMTQREAKGLLSRVFGAMGGRYTAYGGLEGGSVADAQRDNYELVMENTRGVVESARQGGVIMGRNGALILADWPGALHVKLDSPLQARLERVAELEETLPVSVVGTGPDLNSATDNGLARAAELLGTTVPDIMNRATVTGAIVIGRHPGVVHVTFRAPVKALEERGLAGYAREQYAG